MIGASMPEGLNPRDTEKKVTEKEAVVTMLRDSFEHLGAAVGAVDGSRTDEPVKCFGESENTVRGVLLFLPKHVAEHQGPLIAYAP